MWGSIEYTYHVNCEIVKFYSSGLSEDNHISIFAVSSTAIRSPDHRLIHKKRRIKISMSAPHRGGETAGIETEEINHVVVTLCIKIINH